MSPEKRIRAVLRRHGRLEDEAARAQLRILRQIRRAIIGDLTEALGFNRLRLFALLSAIDAEIARGMGLSATAAMQATRAAFGLGGEMVRAIDNAGVLTGLSNELLQAAIEVTTEQLRDVWVELGSRLRNVIRRVTLGITDPYEGMRLLARSIRDPKTFGRAFTRAEAIVRTEVNRTFSIASQGELERAAGAGLEIRKWWLNAEDSRVRDAHVQAGKAYPKDAAIPWDQPFMVDGEALMHPLDPVGSAENTINCFLPGTRIGGRVLAASKALYAGAAWRIETARGHRLAVTPNHPVLTDRGWLPAKEIREGDHLLSNLAEVDLGPPAIANHVDHQNAEPTVDQVFEALAANGRTRTRVVSRLDFHGDAAGVRDAHVDVVGVDGEILRSLEAGPEERGQDLGLVEHAAIVRAPLSREGAALHFGGIGFAAADSSMGGGNLALALALGHVDPLQPLLLGPAARFDSPLPENAVDREPTGAAGRRDEAVAFREAQHRLAGLVAPDEVVRVIVDAYTGPVFDVQTDVGWLHSNGIIAHNCRCVSVPLVVEKKAANAA